MTDTDEKQNCFESGSNNKKRNVKNLKVVNFKGYKSANSKSIKDWT